MLSDIQIPDCAIGETDWSLMGVEGFARLSTASSTCMRDDSGTRGTSDDCISWLASGIEYIAAPGVEYEHDMIDCKGDKKERESPGS